jgi:hypothetical protein
MRALDKMVGRTPWSARVPLDPRLVNEIICTGPEQADGGVGRGPWGPPHCLCRCKCEAAL